MAFILRIYTTDSEKHAKAVEDMIRSAGPDGEEAARKMAPFLKKEVRNPADVLLSQVKGQFLWMMAEFYGNGVDSPELFELQIYFHADKWIMRLPEIYQNQNTLSRFLSVFQTIYEDMERKIRSDADCLDAASVEEEGLFWLAGLMALEDPYQWNRERLRRYLQNGINIYRFRGTKKGLVQLIQAFTGEVPCMMEPDEELNRPYLTVWIREQTVPDRKEYNMLLRLIQKASPAWIEVRLVTWKPCFVLGVDTCLGINSVISRWDCACLDGMSMLSRTLLGGEKI